jgi:hypothetical protein
MDETALSFIAEESKHILLFGEGDTAVVTREVLRRTEHNPELRPGIHVGG